MGMLNVGDKAPDFDLPDQHGNVVKLSGLSAEGPVVVYFYPAAMTPGCTREACHFRDLDAEFGALGARRVGISADPVSKQERFDAKYGLGFPLLSDPDRRVADAFGVKRGLSFLPNKRTTFVVDRDAIVREVISSEVSMSVHADRALAALRRLASPP